MADGPRAKVEAKVVATAFGSIKPLGFAGPWMTLLMSSVTGWAGVSSWRTGIPARTITVTS